MVEIEQFFEDYELGAERVTVGRTITETDIVMHAMHSGDCLLYTSTSPRDKRQSRMPSSA